MKRIIALVLTLILALSCTAFAEGELLASTMVVNASGAMLTGWQEVGGLYYFFHGDGHKAVNEYISGFYVDHKGVWQRP